MAQNTTQSVFGGTTPLIATALITTLGTATAPAAYLIVCAVITILGSFAASRFSSRIRRAAATACGTELEGQNC